MVEVLGLSVGGVERLFDSFVPWFGGWFGTRFDEVGVGLCGIGYWNERNYDSEKEKGNKEGSNK